MSGGLESESLARKSLRHLPFLVLLAYLGVVFDGLLFYTQGVYENDAFYHARYSQMLPQQGLSRSFPWMQFSLWRDQFCDKDFLYHVAMMPFVRAGEALVGAKVFTLLLALGVMVAAYVALVRWRVPWAVVWVGLLALGSGIFLSRMLMIRSHGLSILLMVLSLYVIARGRFWPCFVVGFVYSWSYSFPLAMGITAIGMECSRRVLLGNQNGAWKAVAGSFAGVIAGLLIHPYSPNTVSTLWLLLNISAAGATGGTIELGSEFRPLEASAIPMVMPGLLAALLLSIVGALWLRFRKTPEKNPLSFESAAVLGAAVGWFAGLFVFMRMAEYFAPAVVFAAALVTRDILRETQLNTKMPRNGQLAALLASVLLLAGCHQIALQGVRGLYLLRRPFYPSDEAWYRGQYFGGAAAWLKSHAPAGATVINFHWDDFPELYYQSPEHHYLVGMDPTLMSLKHPEDARVLEDMRTIKRPLDLVELGQRFKSRFVVMRKYRAQAFSEVKSGTLKPAYADDLSVVFEIPAPESKQ